MKDRLIKLLKQSEEKCNKTKHCDKECSGYGKGMDCTNYNTADYLLANGVIVPPCKIGDTVYKVVNDKRVKHPYECKVVGFWYSADETCNDIHLVRYVNDVFDSSFSIPFTDFDKTVFLSREDAEKALAERDKK